MQLPAAEVIDLLENQPDLFEKQVLAGCCKSAAFFDHVNGLINTDRNDPKSRQDDFTLPQDNEIFSLVRTCRTANAGAKDFDVLTQQLLSVTFSAMVAAGIRRPEQAAAVERRLEELMGTSVETVLPMFENAVPYWLEMRRSRRCTTETTVSEMGKTIDSERIIEDHPLFAAPNPISLSSGIPAFDALTGGFSRQEFVLGVGYTGSGKTLFACQLAAAFSSNGYPGMFVTAEAPEDEIRKRVFMNFYDIKADRDMKSEDMTGPTPGAGPVISELQERVKNNLQIYDWFNTKKSISHDLEQEVKAFKTDRGVSPHWLILDWIGNALGDIPRSEQGRTREYYERAGDKLAAIAREENLVCIALTQANDKGKNNARVDELCIAECHTLGRDATTVFGISLIKEDLTLVEAGGPLFCARQYLHVAKSKRATGLAPVVQKPRLQRFETWDGTPESVF